MVGATIGPYRVVSKLGEGGMGEVYRGRDARLHRDVALKVLPASVAGDPDRLARFEREARVLASLNHPNVAQIYGLEESGDVRALVMELVEGSTLEKAIPPAGLAIDRLLDVAGAMAAALGAAHEKGIVHRDLKPSNVMLSADGHVKVLDFGLAKETRAATGVDATQTSLGQTAAGVVMGTPAYMAPEQIAGRPVDHRTDLFAFGIVLFEMATGRRPFEASSSAELASAILRDPPPALADLRPDLPADLARVIRRLLEKDPGERLQSAREVGLELRDLARQLAARPAPGPGVDSRGAAQPAEDRSEAPSDPARSPSPPRGARPASGSTVSGEGFWVAVLPFSHRGSDPAVEALAEGLTEAIVAGLSRFSYLRVIAPSATSRYVDHDADVRQIGRDLGARYVMEGSLRQAGASLRLTAQLVDAETATHVWAETYDRRFSPDAVFALQDDLVPRIVSTAADWYGALPRSMSEALRLKPPGELSPYEAVLRSFGYFERIGPQEHAAVRAGLERAVAESPGNADAWAMLSMLYGEEHRFGLNARPEPLRRALDAAHRAVDAAQANHFAWLALAQAHYFLKEVDAFRAAADRALALNPMDGAVVEYLGHLIAFSGDWDRGCDLAERARHFNPGHPGWYWSVQFLDAYRKGDYEHARTLLALKINQPGHHFAQALLAALYGQLGEGAEASERLRAAIRLKPDFAETARDEFAKWYQPELVDQLMEGLAKAGLDAGRAAAAVSGGSAPAVAEGAARSDAARRSGAGSDKADQGFWVAVLPFSYRGGDASLETLAEALADEVATGLSRFSYLRVISRGSTRPYLDHAGDVRVIGRELGARYIVDGSLRVAGSALRVAVQLVDCESGAHLWAETYARTFDAGDPFALQDDLVPRIVSTVGDNYGALMHSMIEELRQRPGDQLTPYEAVLRGYGYYERIDAAEHAEVRDLLERVLERSPGHADVLRLLTTLYVDEYRSGFNPRPDPLGRALATARRAVEAGPTNATAHLALGVVHFFRRELTAFRPPVERALALNPFDSGTMAFAGVLLAFAGEWERGCALAARARELNPHHPGWFWFAPCLDAYRRRDYREALEIVSRFNLPGHPHTHMTLAAVAGQLGDERRAGQALAHLVQGWPQFATDARGELAKWFDDGLVEHLLEGLRKAGLGRGDASSSGVSSPRGSHDGSSPRPGPARGVAIAVLPFSDLSPARDQEFLCEGMADEITHSLGRIDGIRVTSRTSALRARQERSDVRSIAEALSVGFVLEGSVRTSGSRLRVTAQLTDTASGYQLWSERFDREAADVFAVQDEIAGGVVAAVKARLTPGSATVPARATARNLDAYRAYLRGRHLRRKEDHPGAIKAFEEAVWLDAAYAPAWTGLAEAYALAAHFSIVPVRDACAKATGAIASARAIEGESAGGLHAEAFVALIERRWEGMERAWRRALELDPDHVEALGSLGFSLCVLGRLDEAQPLFERARQLDPLSSFPYMVTGGGYLACDRRVDAEHHLDDALAREPDDLTAGYLSGMLKIARGLAEPGLALLEHARSVSRRGPHFVAALGWALATIGRTAEARALLVELRTRPADAPLVVSEAWLLGALGERDAAFDILDRAATGHVAMAYYFTPGFDALRSDPRWHALRDTLGLPRI